MSLNQHPALKKAVLDLPQQEKDKLLVRLVGKDELLVKQLHFQLLEDETDLEERVNVVKQQLQLLFERITDYIENVNAYHNAHQLMGELKYGSGIINEHFSVTKDKMSEVQLRLLLISQSFEHFDKLFEFHPYGRNDKLLNYQAGRIRYLLGKYETLHEDLQFEFRDELNAVLVFARQSGMNPHMSALGLPKAV